MDINKKFLYINPSASNEDNARMFPVSSLRAFHMTDTDDMNISFDDAGNPDHTIAAVRITDGLTKTVMREFVEAINFSKDAVIVLADQSDDSSVSANIDFAGTISFTEGAEGVSSLASLDVVGALTAGSMVSDAQVEATTTVTAGTTVTATSGNFIATSGTLDVKDGGAVTQATNRTTGVTLNKLAGKVTGDDASLAPVTIAKHTVTNSTVAANDVVIVSKVSGDADSSVYVDAVSDNSFVVAVRNNAASGNDVTALIYNFVVIKGSNS